jgi:hypothetical protein
LWKLSCISPVPAEELTSSCMAHRSANNTRRLNQSGNFGHTLRQLITLSPLRTSSMRWIS